MIMLKGMLYLSSTYVALIAIVLAVASTSDPKTTSFKKDKPYLHAFTVITLLVVSACTWMMVTQLN